MRNLTLEINQLAYRMDDNLNNLREGQLNIIKLIHFMNHLVNFLYRESVTHLSYLNDLNTNLDNQIIAIHTLISGNIPQQLVDFTEMQNILQQVNQNLKIIYPNLDISIQDPNKYYKIRIKPFRTKNNIMFIMNIPLSMEKDKYYIFKLSTFQIPLIGYNGTTNQYSQIVSDKQYIGINKYKNVILMICRRK